MIPLWFVLALSAAMVTASIPLVQEKFKANGFALALWIKVFVMVLTVPALLYVGVPDHPLFYVYLAATAVLYSISDVVYFNAVPKVGSGVVTRLLPVSVIVTFFAWFIVDPALLQSYISQPVLAAGIVAILMVFFYCATRIKQCAASWDGLRQLWFPIVAACIGPILSKLSMNYAGEVQAPFAYTCIQAAMMIGCFGIFQMVRKPVSRSTLMAGAVIRPAILMAVISSIMIVLKMKAIQLVDNPAFVSMVVFTDALWVLLVYRLIGKKEHANIWAGLGIVACAVAVLLLKTFL